MSALFERRFGIVYLLAFIFLAVGGLTRVVLLLQSGDTGLDAPAILGAFAIGAGFDLVTAGYFAIPLILHLTLLPERFHRSRMHRALLQLGVFATLYLLLFVAVSETIFWEEFESRFNFIAVDYLVYTTEVIGNIRESYPVTGLLTVIGAAALSIFLMVRRLIRVGGDAVSLPRRLRTAAALLALPIVSTFAVDSTWAGFSANRYANELAGNGIYDFFAAFRQNVIDYTRFYAVEDEERVFHHLRALLAEPGTRYLSADPRDITRRVAARGPERRLNVVLITVESLSAEFLGVFGSTLQATPHLDTLARDSLLFTNLYATGTRTDRGLEAITLSVPPTPGRSIVKRPHNEDMFSLGRIFRAHGYRTEFLYGGYGYFDNMNYFFSHNGFDVVDRNDIAAEDIHFANVWGVADEDLYTKTIGEIDRAHADGQPFFGLVMTTSNHRPYTYPEGRIDIPSPGGRTGAVKYTDYAIGDFIERARDRPWFDRTLFVIVADHCAKSAGRDALTAARYRIPMLVYAPRYVTPGRVDRLMSQIDVAPTLLGLLNFSYDSRFFGRDALAPRQPDAGRALLGNYQKLGYLKDGELAVLAPRRSTASYRLGSDGAQQLMRTADRQMVDDAITYYEGASLLYQRGMNHYP
ncbi:MAG: LTA synthase family protein [Pseudomonadota bacterium]